MSSTPFRFKQFSINDKNAALKVGTDAVLLGAWVDPKSAKTILDIGTGCGIIALMLAQKSNAQIDAIDIDAPSIEHAKENFLASPWPDRLSAHHISLQEYALSHPQKYDIVVSNPPFFDNALPAATQERNKAKHTHYLSFSTLCQGIASLLTPEGSAYLILPTTEAERFLPIAQQEGLFCQKITQIQPTPTKTPNRWLLALGKTPISSIPTYSITIRDSQGNYTPIYNKYTQAYHPFL